MAHPLWARWALGALIPLGQAEVVALRISKPGVLVEPCDDGGTNRHGLRYGLIETADGQIEVHLVLGDRCRISLLEPELEPRAIDTG